MAGQLIPEYPGNSVSLNGQPGCFHCGASKRDAAEKLYQFDKMVDEILTPEGGTHRANVAVLCEACIIEIATVVGCASPANAAGLRSRIETLGTQIGQLEDAIGTREELNAAIAKLSELVGELVPSA